jgi:HD-GYP domain-containing protein (c-di-GMP phosphodiesterase class II)
MYEKAKENIKRVISDIKNTGGEFDFVQVENTVKDLFNFINRSDSAFIYLTKEIFSYDDYLYNHSINVCTIAAAALKRFNEQFSASINSFLSHTAFETPAENRHSNGNSFIYYLPEEQHDMAVGFFLHDVGKVLIPDEILNKTGKLTSEEFEIVKKHSFEKGLKILDQNGVQNPLIANIVKYHHGPLLQGEDRCYPEDKLPIEIPTYVKICKLADIYDAMTSKRSYKDALNPIGVVTDIFRKYAEKDRVLHFILHSFVNIVGIYPAGSIVCLNNRQMAFIIDSDGPIVIPFTDAQCNSLRTRPDPIDLGKPNGGNPQIKIDTRKPLISPAEAYKLLPAYLKASMDQ